MEQVGAHAAQGAGVLLTDSQSLARHHFFVRRRVTAKQQRQRRRFLPLSSSSASISKLPRRSAHNFFSLLQREWSKYAEAERAEKERRKARSQPAGLRLGTRAQQGQWQHGDS